MSRIAAAVVAAAVLVGLAGYPAAAAPGLPAPSDAAGGLSVFVTPDPTTGPSTAYVYSPVDLAAPPNVRVSGPHLHTTTLRAVFSHAAQPGTWWTASLPAGAAGSRSVRASARTSAGPVLVGTDSYEVIRADLGAGPTWTSSGPAASGGLLAVDPRHPQHVYVASALTPQLWVSPDGGASWALRRGLPVAGGYPTALVALPGGRLVLSVNGSNGGYTDDPTYTGKVFESDDGGVTWRDLQAPDAFVEKVLASDDGRTLVAVTATGVAVSTDGGAWRWFAAPWGRTDYSAAALAGDDLYVATFVGLFVMHDVARATAGPAPAFTPPDSRSRWVTTVAGDGRGIYAVAFYGGMFASRDGGTTWTHVYDPPGRIGLLTDLGGTLLASSGTELLVSRDGAATWTRGPQPLAGASYSSAGRAGARIYLSANDGGVFVSADDAATFTFVGGVPDINAMSLAVSAGRVIAGTPSDAMSTTLGNATTGRPAPWNPPAVQTVSGTTISLMATTPDGRTAYKVRNGPRTGTYTIYASTDGGVSWQQRSPAFYGSPGAILIDPADPSDVYVSTASRTASPTMVVSRDAGATWATLTPPAAISALAGDPSRPGRIWLGGPAGLWRSTDGGVTATLLSTAPVSALHVLADHRLVVGGSSLSYSDDGGRTLHPASAPALDVTVSALVASPTVPGLLFAGTTRTHDAAGFVKGGHGVFDSVDGGVHWAEFDNGLTDRDVDALALTPDGARLFAGTVRGGVSSIPVLLH